VSTRVNIPGEIVTIIHCFYGILLHICVLFPIVVFRKAFECTSFESGWSESELKYVYIFVGFYEHYFSVPNVFQELCNSLWFLCNDHPACLLGTNAGRICEV